VKKLPTHPNAATEWHNSLAPLQLTRRANLTNRENLTADNSQEKSKKSYR
jgi:hypothetical protein